MPSSGDGMEFPLVLPLENNRPFIRSGEFHLFGRFIDDAVQQIREGLHRGVFGENPVVLLARIQRLFDRFRVGNPLPLPILISQEKMMNAQGIVQLCFD